MARRVHQIVAPMKASFISPWLKRIAATVLVLNVFDGIVTLALIHTGLATEANPLMDELLGHGPVQFMFFKSALVSLSVLLLWRLRQQRIACLALYAAAATYGLLAIYHVRSLNALARFIV